jgi:hypothetical protein
MRALLFFLLFFSSLAVHAQTQGDMEVKVFPNPFTSYLSINAPEAVKKVLVYNTIGTQMKSFYFETNQRYYVGDLPRGIYLIQFLTSDNKILTTRRASKKD